jgi:hypothetical protein
MHCTSRAMGMTLVLVEHLRNSRMLESERKLPTFQH